MQKFRLLTARGGRPTPHSIAEEIWAELDPKPLKKSPLSFVSARTRTEEVEVPVGRAKIIRHNLFQPDAVQVGDTLIELGEPVRSDFLKQVCDLDIFGPVRIPTEREACQRALDAYAEYVRATNSELARASAAYTADEHMQERVVKELWRLVGVQES